MEVFFYIFTCFLIFFLRRQRRNLLYRTHVKDDTTMRNVNDHLSYKTHVANFLNFANFFNSKHRSWRLILEHQRLRDVKAVDGEQDGTFVADNLMVRPQEEPQHQS